MQARQFLKDYRNRIRGGIYVLQPDFARSGRAYKMGMATSYGRIAEYKLFWPHLLGSYKVHAYGNVGGGRIEAREKKMHRLAEDFGFKRDDPRNEWFVYDGSRGPVEEALYDLFQAVRSGIDGNFWVFAGDTLFRRGGRVPEIDWRAAMRGRRTRSGSDRAYEDQDGNHRPLRSSGVLTRPARLFDYVSS